MLAIKRGTEKRGTCMECLPHGPEKFPGENFPRTKFSLSEILSGKVSRAAFVRLSYGAAFFGRYLWPVYRPIFLGRFSWADFLGSHVYRLFTALCGLTGMLPRSRLSLHG